MKKLVALVLTVLLAATAIVGVSAEKVDYDSMTMDELLANIGGYVGTAGLPDYWTDWGNSFAKIKEKYGIDRNVDPDLSSSDEINMFIAEKDDPTMDLGDVGFAFTVVAEEEDCIQPYTVDVWDQIPDWAKDPEHMWAISYTGTSSIIYNTAKLGEDLPTTWQGILEADFPVVFGNVGVAANAQQNMVALNFAMGGDWDNIQPCIDYAKKLMEQGRIVVNEGTQTDFETGECIACLCRLDFTGTLWEKEYNEKNIDGLKLKTIIPQDGAVTTGYALIMNKWAPHPYDARVVLNYLFSDEGQIDRARGGARPIRAEYIDIPEDCPVLGNEWYKGNIIYAQDPLQLNKTCTAIAEAWEEEILPFLN